MWRCKKTANRSPLRRSQCGTVCRLGIWKRCYRRLCAAASSKAFAVPTAVNLLAGERHDVTANEILRAAGAIDETEEELNSELVAKVVLPVLSAAEQECGQALNLGSVWTISLTAQPSTATERRFVTAEEENHVTHYHRMLGTRPSM